MRKLVAGLGVLAWLMLFCAFARAADITGSCGRDTDQDGTVTQFCPTPDADWDGDASVAGGGTDCDDQDFVCRNGIACFSSAGNYKLCSAGTFGGVTASSSYTCKAGTGTDRWVTDSVADCGHAGTYADPNNYACHFNSAMTGYVAPAGDDCIILKGGTYSSIWNNGSNRQFRSTLSGSSGHPIKLRTEPGALVTITGHGTSGAGIEEPVIDIPGQWWDIVGNEGTAKGLYGFKIDCGYAAKCVYINGGDGTASNNIVRGIWVKDTRGNCGSTTCGGIEWDGGGSNNTFSHNMVQDTFKVGAETNNNAANITGFRGTGNQILYNTLFASNTTQTAHAGLFYKHGDVSGNANGVFRGNLISGGSEVQVDIAVGGMTYDHNLFVNGPASVLPISLRGGSGASYFQGASTIELNTFVGAPAAELWHPGAFEQTEQTFTATAATDIITYAGLDMPNLTKVRVASGTTLPAPLAATTDYWTVRQTATTSKLSTTSDGLSIVDLTDAGTGTHTISVVLGAITYQKNIVYDTRASAYGADGNSGMIRVNNAGTDLNYRATVGQTGKLSINNNDYFNSNAVALLFNIYGKSGSPTLGANYSSFAAWSASGFFNADKNEDPSLDTYNIARSANTSNWGWRPASGLAAEGGSTGATSGRGFLLRIIKAKRIGRR